MNDIANEAGLARKTLYRHFASRADLMQAVCVYRLNEMTRRVVEKLAGCDSFAEAIVLGSQEIIRLAREDSIFMAVVSDTAPEGELLSYFVDPESTVFLNAQTMWSGVLDRARQSGEVCPGLNDTDIENWLRAVHLVLLLREDLSEAGQRQLLETFVLPALVVK